MTTTPAGKDPENTMTVELTQAEAIAVATALFMCLRPNNVHPPFEPLVNIEAMENGYRKIASPVSELEGRSCARCGRSWVNTMPPWDSIGDPETGELDTVCQDCTSPQEQAARREHHERFVQYAKKLYSTPSWKAGPSGTSQQ
jgi:hypothetical protein